MQPTEEARSARQPGRMTSVMRAMSTPTGPKVLRIGLVRAGKIVDERVIKDLRTVTIGASEKNDFVLVGGGVPATFKLFERVGDGYRLHVPPGCAGRVALPDGAVDVAHANAPLALGDDARGRLVIAGTTVLFQFVAPPPQQTKPQLPASVQGSLVDGIDWSMTAIAAFSFLFHFGAIGVLHSDWSDRVMPEEADVSGLVQTFTNLPKPPAITEVPVPTEAQQPTAAQPTAANGGSASPIRRTAGGRPSSSGPPTPKQGAVFLAELERMDAQVIGVFTASGPSTRAVLVDGNVPTGAMDAIARSSQGVGVASDLRLGAPGGPVKPGQGAGELAGIGGPSKGSESSGVTASVKGPTQSMTGSFNVPPGRISGAEATLGGARGRVRACYQAVLQQNPDMEGNVSFSLSVGSTGNVVAVSASPSGSITGGVASCIQGVLRTLHFDSPEGGAGATITGSYRFLNGSKK